MTGFRTQRARRAALPVAVSAMSAMSAVSAVLLTLSLFGSRAAPTAWAAAPTSGRDVVLEFTARLADAPRLVQQDRAFKQQLYRAKAGAAGAAPGKAGEVARIYDEVWKQYAKSGWWVQDSACWWRK